MATRSLAQRPGADRLPDGFPKGRGLIGETIDKAGLHDRHVVGGDVGLEAILAVLKVQLHGAATPSATNSYSPEPTA